MLDDCGFSNANFFDITLLVEAIGSFLEVDGFTSVDVDRGLRRLVPTIVAATNTL